jgi:hypothetical protein
MKAFKARFKLIDCGRASRRTKGLGSIFSEAGAPPFNRWG